jgi:hypothetical protein
VQSALVGQPFCAALGQRYPVRCEVSHGARVVHRIAGEREVVLLSAAPRIPIAAAPKRAEDECAHDGECADSGCGFRCLSLQASAGELFACEGRPDLEERLADAYCGCIHGHCQWFEQ